MKRSGIGRPRDRAAGEMKDRILGEAARLFASKGYRGTSVQQVVDAAGVTKPTLYHYYANKEELYRAVLKWSVDRRRRFIREAEGGIADPRERVLSLLEAVFSEATESPDLARLGLKAYFAPVYEAPALDVSTGGRILFRSFRRAVQDGIVNGTIHGNAFEIARLLLGASVSYVTTHLDDPSRNIVGPGAAERVVEMIWDGVGESIEE